MDSFRTFIAIELGAEVRGRAMEHIKRLRRELPDVRGSFSREDNLHLTLKFLGNVPVTDIPKVSDAVDRAAATVSPFELTFSNCGTFPTHGRPGVLWIGAGSAGRGPQAGSPFGMLDIPLAGPARSATVSASSNLDRLYSAIEERLAEVGFIRDSRPFHPHLTIARLRHSQGARQLAELHKGLGFPPITFAVSQVVVFKSELSNDGSKHTAVSRHKLR